MSFGFAHGAIQWLAADGAATVYTVSGLSFQPKVLRFYCQGLHSAGIDAVSQTVNQRMSVGFAVSTSSRRCVSVFDTDAAGSMACGRGAHDAAVIATVTAAGAFDGLLDLNSITADGFTLIVDDAAPANLTVFWEAWGGSDITVAEIVHVITPPLGGNVDVTVTGFTAAGTDQVVMFLANPCVATTLPLAEAESSRIGIGFASGGNANNNITLAGINDHGSASADASNYALSGQCLAYMDDATSTTVRTRAVVTQWNTDGFRINFLEKWINSVPHFALAIKGGQWYAGDYTIAGNTLNATTAVTAPGFQPEGICFIGGLKAEHTDDTASLQAHLALGTASSTSSRRSMGFLGEDGNTDSQCNFTIQYDQCLAFASNAGGLLSAYDLQSLDANGFTVIVDVAGGVASEWQGYLAFAGNAVVGPVVNTVTPQDNLAMRDARSSLLSKLLLDRQHLSDAIHASALRQLISSDREDVSDSTAASVLRALVLSDQQHVSDLRYLLRFLLASDREDVSDSVSATAIVALVIVERQLSESQLFSDSCLLGAIRQLIASEQQIEWDNYFTPGVAGTDEAAAVRFVTRASRAWLLQPESAAVLQGPPPRFEAVESGVVASPAVETSLVTLQIIRQLLTLETQHARDDAYRTLLKILTDHVDLTDSAALTIPGGVILTVLVLSDNLAVSDTAARLLLKLLGDRQDARDTLSEQIAKLVTEAQAPLGDQAYRMLLKTLGDAETIGDTVARLLAKHITERQDVRDNAATTVLVALTFSDNLSVRDTATRLLLKLLTERQSVSDTVAISRFVCLTLIDSVLMRDDGTRTLLKVLSDRELISEAALLSMFRFLLASDREDVSDNVLRYVTRFLLTQETQAPISDTRSSVLIKTLADRQHVSDTVLLYLLRVLLASDREDVSDSVQLTRLKIVLAQDFQSPISDNIARVLLKILGDQVVLSDSVLNTVAGLLIIFLTFSDSVLVSDAVTRDLYKLISDREGISDTALLQRIRFLLASDREPVSDEAKLSRLLLLALLDAMNASDSSSNALSKLLGDRQDVSDTIARTLYRTLLATDREHITDAATFNILGRILTLLIAENLAVQDAIAKTLLKHIGEPQFTADSFIKELAKSLTERQGVSDNTLFQRTIFRLAQDSETLTDTSAQFLVRLIILALADVLTVDDRTIKILLKNIGDQTILSDDVARTFVRFLLTGDQVSPSDSAARQLVRFLGASDTQFVADVVSRVTAKLISDPELVHDEIVRELRKIVLDRVDLSDSAIVDQIISQLTRLFLSDNVGIADRSSRELLKVIAEEAAVRDDLDLQMAQGVRRFIEFMLTREGSPLGMTGGSEQVQGLHASRERPAKSPSGMKAGEEGNYRLVTRVVDPQKKGPGTKGVRR